MPRMLEAAGAVVDGDGGDLRKVEYPGGRVGGVAVGLVADDEEIMRAGAGGEGGGGAGDVEAGAGAVAGEAADDDVACDGECLSGVEDDGAGGGVVPGGGEAGDGDGVGSRR